MSKIDEYLMYLISTTLFINLVATVSFNLSNLNTILILSVGVVALLIYNELFCVNENNKSLQIFIILVVVFLILIYMINHFQFSTVKVFMFVMFYQIIKKFNKTKFYMIILFEAIYLYFILVKETDALQVIKILTYELSLLVLIIIIILLVLYIINQNKKLELIREELVLNHLALENTHRELLKAYNELESYTILKERGKIAREMHDSVGHTLTTALVELEVSRLLYDKNDSEAKEKMKKATDQVRKGLADLRRSVKTLKENIDYVSEINELISNTADHANIRIKTFMDELEGINQNILGCVYRILQEGLTNGIKHGKADAFIFRLTRENKILKLYLEDNGKGTTVFKKGFGITAMEERVMELNGDIQFEYAQKLGFAIFVSIPLV